MKRVERKGVWETNSSAVHSLTYAKDGLEPSSLPVDEDGYIITDFGDFGDYDMGITAFDQATKLSYLATECYYTNHYDDNLDESYQWQHICEAICNYTGAKGIKILHKTEPQINHQEVPGYEPKFCDYWREDSVLNFVFNKYIGVKMSHD